MDFLASFNFDADPSANPQPSACASVQELQLRLAESLANKATPTRAEHVATTLDLDAAARFSIDLAPAEMHATEGLSHMEPSSGGTSATEAAAEGSDEHTTRQFSAADALTRQPQDDPVLQRVVARHIAAAIGATDGCSWIMREMSRATRGWDFSYLCKDSAQHWDRQYKSKTKPVIAEYTQKDMDPALATRPAFDCRGSVKISFDRGDRSISIKYHHTPLHRTVAEVAELFKPAPRPLPTLANSEKQQSPRKVSSARKRRAPTKTADDTGNARKRRRKTAPEAPMQAPEQQPLNGDGAPNGDGPPQPADAVAAHGSAVDAPQPAQASNAAVPAANFPLNLSAEEAERRRNAAKKLLSEAGVEPDTLSADQFNIFANQSPDLQRESLSMLVKYGAERLRIVHPSSRESSAPALPSNMSPPAPNHGAAPSAPMTTTELVPRPQDSADDTEVTEAVSAKPKRRKWGKSRNACLPCKGRKVKCPRERPSCVECQTAGLSCEYAPPKPRNKKTKLDVMVPAGYDAEEDAHLDPGLQQQLPEEQAPEHAQTLGPVHQAAADQDAQDESGDEAPEEASPEEEEEAQDEPPDELRHGGDADYSPYPQMAVSDMLTPNVDVQNHANQQAHQIQPPYFRSASGLALPQPEEPPVSQQMHLPGSGLVLPEGTVHFPSLATTSATDTTSSHQQTARGPQRHTSATTSQQGRDGAVSGWQSSPRPSSRATMAAVSSPQPRTSQPNPPAADEPSSHGANRRVSAASSQMQDVVAISQAALDHQRQAQSLPTTMQPAAQGNSFNPTSGLSINFRQTQRAQSKTPRAAQPSGSAFQAPPGEPTAMRNSTDGGQYRSTTQSANNASFNSSYGGYPEAPSTSTPADRVGYEPYAYRRSSQSTASFPNYDYGHSAMEDSSATSAYPANSTLNLPDSSASRGHQAPSRNSLPYSTGNSGAAQAAGQRPSHVSASNPELNPRAAPQPARPAQGQGQVHGHGHGHGQGQGNGSMDRHHLPQHSQRRQQQQQQPGQGHPGQNWYGFNNDGGNSSYPLGLQRSTYDWKMADEPWGGFQ